MRLFLTAIVALASANVLATPTLGARIDSPYGAPARDPDGIIDLPVGFAYKIVARVGDIMTDGLRVPALPEGMGAFAGPDGTTMVVCNHECLYFRDGAFGASGAAVSRIDPAKIYDRGDGIRPAPGAATTFVWNTRTQTLVRHSLSLAGTLFNCGGGRTPWGSWLSCEELTHRAGYREDAEVVLQRDHGWVFEVPARADGELADPVPLTALGRFTHEAIAYDEGADILYQTEDLSDGLIYRFVPERRRDLRAGGRLQALGFKNGVRETNNQVHGVMIETGKRFDVRWIDLDAVDAPLDDLRLRGYALGACRFSRPEGVCMIDGVLYFSCTSGGALGEGQIWRYVPSKHEGRARERQSPGYAELFCEVSDTTQMVRPDNLAATPFDELLVCEDPEHSPARLLVMDREGRFYTFAQSRRSGALAGAVFSPDGSTLFVNMQNEGIMLAITGPWSER